MTDERAPLPFGVRWPDVALAAVVVAVVILGTAHIEQEDAARAHDAVAFVCGIAGGLSLAVWRRFTLVMVGVVAVTMFVYLVRGYPGGPALLPGPIAAGFLGYRTPRPLVWWVSGAFAATSVVGQWIGESELGVGGVIGIGWVVAAVFAGQVLAARGERAAAARERARFAEQQAITDERLRIARDLHDSVAHAMATINVQSGVAAHLLDRRPEQARAALEAIRQASSDVLDELGAILGALRRDDGDAAPRAPTAGVDRIGELVERSRADGLAVTCTVAGDPSLVPPSLGTAAYRVVQESLSNARRHAGPGSTVAVDVTIAGPGALTVSVVDDGGGRRANGARRPVETGLGLGLAGMRERVESTGGRLAVGARRPPARGFSVRAEWGGTEEGR